MQGNVVSMPYSKKYVHWMSPEEIEIAERKYPLDEALRTDPNIVVNFPALSPSGRRITKREYDEKIGEFLGYRFIKYTKLKGLAKLINFFRN